MPLVPVFEHYGVELSEGRWGNQLVLCPVHGEGHASMSVNVEKGVFICFACDARGDAVRLVQLMEGCDRADAERRAEKLVRDSGYQIPERPGRRYKRPSVSGQSGDNPGGRPWRPLGRRTEPYQRP